MQQITCFLAPVAQARLVCRATPLWSRPLKAPSGPLLTLAARSGAAAAELQPGQVVPHQQGKAERQQPKPFVPSPAMLHKTQFVPWFTLAADRSEVPLPTLAAHLHAVSPQCSYHLFIQGWTVMIS